MKKQPAKFKRRALPHLLGATLIATILPASLVLAASTAFASSATWNVNATSTDWYTASNWTPATVPNGLDDTATFGFSNITSIAFPYDSETEVNGILFNPGAGAFTISNGEFSYNFQFTVSGVGITNDSGIVQQIVSADDYGTEFFAFINGASAGSLTAFTNNGGNSSYSTKGGITRFRDRATAGKATFTNLGAYGPFVSGGQTQFFDASSANHGVFVSNGNDDWSWAASTQFFNSSTAGDGIFTNNPAIFGSTIGYPDVPGGSTVFNDTSAAGNGTLTNEGATIDSAFGGQTIFYGTSSAAHATLVADGGSSGGLGGSIQFLEDSLGGNARLKLFGNGNLDISGRNPTGITVGSIEGDGLVLLGANSLTVGSNDRSTTFSGMIQNDGSLTKIGAGTFTLIGANTYTGGTTIEGGELLVDNPPEAGTGTGTGAVQIAAGRLGGKGIIAGAVTVGTGSGPGAVLAPGKRGGKHGTLTIQSTLTFNSDGTYNCGLRTKHEIADKVVARGVTINGAQFTPLDFGQSALTAGIVFTAIDNTAATPIAGTFSNLADGSTFNAGTNTFQVSYEGGDGNDLTLTVQ